MRNDEKLIFPDDCPDHVILARALEKLNEELDSAVLKRTGFPIKVAARSIGVFVLAAYLDTILGPLCRLGNPSLQIVSAALSVLQLGLIIGIGITLLRAYWEGSQLQKGYSAKRLALHGGELCPRSYLEG